jgi:hypothetical protein
MIATNLMTSNTYQVKKYKGWYYIENDFGSDTTKIVALEATLHTQNSLENGFRYNHYEIEGIIYQSFITTNLGYFDRHPKTNEQIKLF